MIPGPAPLLEQAWAPWEDICWEKPAEGIVTGIGIEDIEDREEKIYGKEKPVKQGG
jgi:hypothetical protein